MKQKSIVVEEDNRRRKEMEVLNHDRRSNNFSLVPDEGKTIVAQNRSDGKGSSSTEPIKERTWAQVAGPNRFDALREVADENQTQVEEVGSDSSVSVTAARAQQQQRLSRQLWPIGKGGGRTRFDKIKHLARQIVGNEYQNRAAGAMATTADNERKEVVEIEESEHAHNGSARMTGKESGVNFGKLLEQECCQLRTVEVVGEWGNWAANQ
ncbi:hypothetical protein FRX31_013886 [Thalictrum thalictroides]|uniref:Uncharacterized protein n=1 Tax=Thalictrum thalictroides TaxID=46969 RepID=A0A7J6WHZ2_THATH|nr:hypothetical protein FRX31_013886 [Thalictrum thalictroides]